jgi:hypothetical protein
MTHRKYGLLYVGIGIVAGLTGVLLVSKPSKPSIRTWLLKKWQDALSERYGRQITGRIIIRTQTYYDALIKERPVFRDGCLNRHLTLGTLPVLALYRALEDEFDDQEHCLQTAEEMVLVAYGGLRRVTPALGWFPNPFEVFRFFARAARPLFPETGWRQKTIEDSQRAYHWEMQSCLFVETLTSYGAPELARVFCRVDDHSFETLPEQIDFCRTGTLARGADRCDFRFERVD